MRVRRQLTRMRFADLERWAAAILIVASVGFAGRPGTSQEEATPPTPQPAIARAEARRVAVDVVVRDASGDPITDLVESDFEVLEDGVRQRIEGFTLRRTAEDLVAGRQAATPNEPSASGLTNSGRMSAGVEIGQPGAVALVYDSSSGEGWTRARVATLTFLQRWRRPGQLVGLFAVSGGLAPIQEFTSDDARLLAAVEALGRRSAGSMTPYSEQLAGAASARAAVLAQVTAAARLHGAAGAQAGAMARAMAMQQNMEDVYRQLLRDQRGFASASALLAVVDGLRAFPGRKAVVLFAEALFRTEANDAVFRSIVHAANRANVSIYTIDVSGLAVHTTESAIAQEMNAIQAQNRFVQESGAEGPPGGGSMLQGLERVGDMVQFNPQAALVWLSESTGGFTVRDTNDVADGLRRVEGDLSSYYLLGYSPSDTTFDGRFRRIAVLVHRKAARVHARGGYFAVRAEGPVLAQVAPALAILENGGRPHAFELQTGAIVYPDTDGVARTTIAAAVPCAGLARAAAKARERGVLDLTVLVRVRDARGRSVDVASRRHVIRQTVKQHDASAWRLLRDVWLPPGRYELEAVAYEAATRTAAVTSSSFEILSAVTALDRAQLVLVAEAAPADPADLDLVPGHPLRYGDAVLNPALGTPPHLDHKRPLVACLVLGRDAAEGDPPHATLELWRDGELVSRAAVALASSGAELLQFVGDVPLPRRPQPASPLELRARLVRGDREKVLRVPFVLD